MVSSSRAVALFDIDGTLVRTDGASPHSRAFKAAFRRVYGTECTFSVEMHGMTDLQIFTMLASNLGLDDGHHRDLAAEACRSMVELYKVRDEADGRYVALPGAREVLEQLRQRGVVLGLVTGNVPEIAQDKLAAVGLAEFFRIGAYGSEGDERTVLPPLAVSRAEAFMGAKADPRHVFIVGDTPRDVACALDNGYRAVAVATGHVPLKELLKTRAELVLPDLTDAEPLVRLLTSEA